MTPQEKKRLSYERDRRNTYGENDKSSRRGIPLRKRQVHHANRVVESGALAGLRGAVDGFVAEEAAERIRRVRPKEFRKWSDTPLGEVVTYQLGRRADVDESAAPVEAARIRRVAGRMGRPEPVADHAQVVRWLVIVDRQIRFRDGERRRAHVRDRLARVRRAARTGAFTAVDAALHDARFVAALHRDGLVAEVADLLPDADSLVRACLVEIDVTAREVRAARAGDVHRLRETAKLVEAAMPHLGRLTDLGLRAELRTWASLRARLP